MNDGLWLLVAATTAGIAFFLRQRLLRRFGKSRGARLIGELVGWNGYFLALTIGMVQTNGAWHAERGAGVETQSSWATAPWLFALATLLAFLSYAYREHYGRHPMLGHENRDLLFPAAYVAEILASEDRSTREQCRRMAKQLRKDSRRSGQRLPEPLASFVSRHLDRSV
jgi:hypothetical protein